MSAVLCSAGCGPHAQLLDISEPTLRRYAERWGMDVHVTKTEFDPSRPPSWSKIPLIDRLLNDYETVVWVDADALFVNFDRNILAAAPTDKSIWMVKHKAQGMPDGIPNCGVLVCHRDLFRTTALFCAAWMLKEHINHPWWEQAAILDLIGYRVDGTIATWQGDTDWTPLVGWLGTEWNSMPNHDPHPEPVIRHYSGQSHMARLEGMTKDAAHV